MSAETLLSRLDGVKETGADRWMAKCPSHDDRGPSLSIREVEGRAIIHCFAQCPASDVMAAIGLELSDLLDDKACSKCGAEFHPLHPDHELCPKCFRGDPAEYQRRRPRRSRIPASDILAAIDRDALIVSVIGSDLMQRKSLDEETWNQLATAVDRIGIARDMYR